MIPVEASLVDASFCWHETILSMVTLLLPSEADAEAGRGVYRTQRRSSDRVT